MNGTQWHWHVLGAGAMGSLWAFHLRDGGWPVTLLLRDRDAVRAFEWQGGVLRLDVADRTQARAVQAAPCGAPERIDCLLLATKAGDAAAALASVAHRLHRNSRILLLQNGVAFQEALADRAGPAMFCLTTSHGAWRRAPYHFVHAGQGETWLGSLRPTSRAQQHRALLGQLPASTLGIRYSDDMRRRLWQKFAVNCAVNGLTALHDCANGGLLARPEAAADLDALCEEIDDLLRLLPEAPGIGAVRPLVERVLGDTADNRSSTLQDLRAGRRTELAWLNGWLVHLAARHDLACPRNRELLRRLRVSAPAGPPEVSALRWQC